ncbi:MAG: hypothetical protein J6X28_02650 [Bacilli bacterium]|nr:hypothetical protein [Bacilli bacterium]
MYYQLTKEQYKKYGTEFRKTYVGKNYFITCMLLGAIAVIMLIIMLLLPNIDPNATEITDLTYFVVVSALLICEANIGLQYKRELKDFIQSKEK